VFYYLAGVCQHEIVKGDLVGGSEPTAWSLLSVAVTELGGITHENVFPLCVFPEEEPVLPQVGADGTLGLEVYKVGVSCTRAPTAANS